MMETKSSLSFRLENDMEKECQEKEIGTKVCLLFLKKIIEKFSFFDYRIGKLLFL